MLSKYLNLSFVLFVQNWQTSHLNLLQYYITSAFLPNCSVKSVSGKAGLVILLLHSSQLCKYLSNNIQHGGSLQIKFSFISSDCRLALCLCLFVEGKY